MNDDISRNEAYAALARLAAQLANSNCCGIYLPQENQLWPNDSTAEQGLQILINKGHVSNCHVSYLVIFEQAADGGWGAYAPVLPGLGVVSDTRAEAFLRKGIAMYIAGLGEDGLPISAPTTTAERIAVAA